MPNTCVYRYQATEDAAQESYMEWRESTEDDAEIPEWNDLTLEDQERWKAIFRAGHRAYRRYIRDVG